MQLRIFIAGKERANFPVHPAIVPSVLLGINARLEVLEQFGKVAVTLDSVSDPNLTYLLYPRSKHG